MLRVKLEMIIFLSPTKLLKIDEMYIRRNRNLPNIRWTWEAATFSQICLLKRFAIG